MIKLEISNRKKIGGKKSQNCGKKTNGSKKSKGEIRKYLRDKGKQKDDISKLKGHSKSGAKGEIIAINTTLKKTRNTSK